MKKRAYLRRTNDSKIFGIGHIIKSDYSTFKYEFKNEKGAIPFNDFAEIPGLEKSRNWPFWIPFWGVVQLSKFDRLPIMYEGEYYLWICYHAVCFAGLAVMIRLFLHF